MGAHCTSVYTELFLLSTFLFDITACMYIEVERMRFSQAHDQVDEDQSERANRQR
jgi:hypothetical protein